MGSIFKQGGKDIAKVFGGGGGPGALGTGRFQGRKQDIVKHPFERELGGAGFQDLVRKRQEAQSTRLEETAKGERPSLAEAQLKAATSRSLAQQVGASQARRGGSAASRERQLSRQSGQARRETAEASAVQRVQEQQAAEQQLTQQLAAQRAQDIGIATEDRRSQQRLQELLVQENLGVQGLNLSGFQSSAQQRAAGAQNLATGFGTFSDKNTKRNIKKESMRSDTEELQKSGTKAEIAAHNKKQAKKGVKLSKERRSKEKTSNFLKALGGESSKKEAAKAGPINPTGQSAADKAIERIRSISSKHSKKNIMSMSTENSKTDIKKETVEKAVSKATEKQKASPIKVPETKTVKIETGTKDKKDDEVNVSKFAMAAPKPPAMPAKEDPDISTKSLASSGGGLFAAFSDKSSKQSTKSYSDSNSKMNKEDFSPKSFLDALQAYSYEYKDSHKDKPEAGEGRFLSVMAQDLQKSGPVGRSAVIETPHGKMVDYGKLSGAMLASQAHLNERVSMIEEKGFGKVIQARKKSKKK